MKKLLAISAIVIGLLLLVTSQVWANHTRGKVGPGHRTTIQMMCADESSLLAIVDQYIKGSLAQAEVEFQKQINAEKCFMANGYVFEIELVEMIYAGYSPREDVTIEVWKAKGRHAQPGIFIYVPHFVKGKPGV